MNVIYNYGQILVILGILLTVVSISYFVYQIIPEQDYLHGIGTVIGIIVFVAGLIMWLPSRTMKKHREKLNYHH